jgi:hypothetical protein
VAELPYRGSWWIPGQETRWHGTLDYVAGRLELDVDLPSPGWKVLEGGFEEHELLHGEANDSTPLTLVDVYARSQRSHMPGGAEIIYRIGCAIVGAWFDSREEIEFDEVDVRFHQLDSWLDLSGFDFQFAESGDGFDLSFRRPKTIVVSDADALRVSAKFGHSSPHFVRPLVDVTVRQQALLAMVPKQPLPIDEHVESARRVRNFLSFAADTDAPPISVQGRTNVDAIYPDGETVNRPKWLEIILSERIESAELRASHEMLLLVDDTPGERRSALEAWLERYDSLKPILELFLITLYQPSIYLHLQFLSLAQAIESLHTRKFPDWELPRSEFRERLSRVVDSSPEDLKEWVHKKLRGTNLAPFRKSVEELVETLPPVLRDPIGDAADFSRLVGYTRNYYTHWSERLEEKKADDQELMRLTTGLKWIVAALILVELGFSTEQVEALVRRNIHVAEEIRWAFNPRLKREASASPG